MALPASGGNPGQISASNIANEFGYTNGSETRLGSYRTTNGQGNFPVSFGALQFNSIDAKVVAQCRHQDKLSSVIFIVRDYNK